MSTPNGLAPFRAGGVAQQPVAQTRWHAWQQSVSEYWSQILTADFLLGVLVILANSVFPGVPFPLGVALSAMIVGIGACRRPTVHVAAGGVLLVAGLALFAFLVWTSRAHGTEYTQRTARFVLLLLMAAGLAAGRVDVRSFVLGGCLGLVVNTGLFYGGMTSNNYPPYLTGFFGDKNVAGLYYAIFGALGLMVFTSRRWRASWVIFSLAALLLTGSRTSISALMLAYAWIALRNRVAMPARIALAGLGVWLLVYAEARLAEAEVFASRSASDWFRGQIDAEMDAKISITPKTGLGLNEGYVYLGGVRRMWFHDSYRQAFVEGGYVFLWATLAAFVLLGLGLISFRRTVPNDLLFAEAAIVVVLVCAWKLGEVFMTLGGFVALGIAVGLRLGRQPDRRLPWWGS